MAGAVRQPIDVQSLERYIAKSVPEIQVPIEVKQVGCSCISASITQILTFPIVRFWTVQSDIPADGQKWPEVCYAEEATWEVTFKDST
jgi:hypothetical protein